MEDILCKFNTIEKYRTKNTDIKNIKYQKNPINQKGGFLNNNHKDKKYINNKNKNEDVNSSYTSSSDN